MVAELGSERSDKSASDLRPVNCCSWCWEAVVGSCGLRELDAGEKRVWARNERPVGWAGTVGSSGRTWQVTRMSV